MPSSRKFVLAVKTWGSDEAIHSWKYLKAHILQNSKDGGRWSDELVVVHISRGRTKEKEPWDQGGAVIAGLKTSLQPYKHDVFDLEGDPGPLLVDIANKEQADILVLATRGRNAMKKAMLGSMTDFVMQRANCACLVMKPQVGAGDTYRMKSAANPQGPGVAAALHTAPAPPRAQSPGSSPMFGRITTRHGSTPFNRRVAIAYDTTASGRYLLKWASDTILEPTDNVFVVRAVPKLQMRKPGTSFADKNNVQRLAGDALQGMPHVTTFNLQQGNARKSVLAFASKESVDLLIIGMYRPTTRRKGLAVRGNAAIVANRCATQASARG
ncbi:hypothetical protein COO60DRAFT_1517458 [Scenedesmus sp. NREL 46B-D3]|nr:hypothetical protein COO60DRAFT_1517458 [Scenedesmus sp. NREL 46B-D3]